MLISCFSLCHLDPKPISLEESSLISLEHLAPKDVGTGKVFGLKAMLLHVLAQELSPIDAPLFRSCFCVIWSPDSKEHGVSKWKLR